MFQEFLDDTGYIGKSIRDLPDMLFNIFAKWCAERRTFIRGNGEGARSRAVSLIGILNIALDEHYQSLGWSNLEVAKLRRMKNTFNIQRRPSLKRPPLSGLAGKDCPFSDKQLFQSLRYVNAWLIIEENRQKDIVLSSPNVIIVLDRIRKNHSPDELMTMRSFTHFSEFIKRKPSHPCHLTSIDDLIELAQNVKEVSDELVKESCLRAMSLLQTKSLSKNMILDLSNRISFANKSYCPFLIDSALGHHVKGNRVTAQYKRFTPFELLYPSHTSVTCMINLLASERVQHGGLSLLKINDVITTIDPITKIKGLEINFRKVRAFSSFSSIKYQSNDRNPLVYKAYSTYLESICRCQDILPFEYKGKSARNIPINIMNALLPKYSSGIFEGSMYHISEAVPFRLLSDETSLLREKINNDAGVKKDEFVAPFCWLLDRIIESFTGTRKGSERTQKEKEIEYDRLFLSTEYIGNSRVALDSNVMVAETGINDGANSKDKKPFTLNSALSDVSFLTAHNTDTKHNVYLDRLPTKEKIEFLESVPVRVAELMEIDAIKLISLKNKTKVYTVYEAKKVLGLLNVDELYLSLDEALIGLDGEIKHGNQTLYIATAENAALITRHIEHYESEIPRLLQNHPENRSRIMDAMLSCYKLKLVIKKFPYDIVKNSKDLASQLTDELFPPLV